MGELYKTIFYYQQIETDTNGCHFVYDIFTYIFLKSIVVFIVKVHCDYFPWVKLTIAHYWFRYCFVPNRRQAIIWPNDGLVYWRKYVSLGLDKLKDYLCAMITNLIADNQRCQDMIISLPSIPCDENVFNQFNNTITIVCHDLSPFNEIQNHMKYRSAEFIFQNHQWLLKCQTTALLSYAIFCRNYWCRTINKNYIRPVLVVDGKLGI